ncbi:MAG: sensor histidine kinase [Bacillota bacterium]|nr:sensor histidine kinase [Bacillota bacterium]
MNSKIKTAVITINYCAFILVMLTTCLYDSDRGLMLVSLYFLLILSFSMRTFFLYNIFDKEEIEKKPKLLILLSYCVEIAAILLINSQDSTLISVSLYAFLVDDIVMNNTLRAGIEASIMLYLAASFSILYNVKFVLEKAIIPILLSLPVYIVVYIIFFLINYLLRQTEAIEEALKAITIEKLEKDTLYNNLKEAYERVEAVTALKERNRIAREIHDTVGHTLTTVLVEIEACKRLIRKDTELALEKLNLAQGQVRKGLNDIRGSVRLLENGEDILDFHEALEAIIRDTEKHSGVTIKSHIECGTELDKPQEKVILSALLEGLTNGIRHGKSTAFLFKLHSEGNKVVFSLEDNGCGASVVTPGFGLRAMKERVADLGGSFKQTSKPDEGFGVYITLPYKQ